MSLKILIVGAGAVGGYFGARLVEAGRDVSFLVRPNRAESLKKDGLRILSPHGDLTVRPRIVLPGEISRSYDLIFLSVKSYALEAAMTDFTPAMANGSFVLPVLNGVRHIDLLNGRFGEDSVLGGVCYVVTELDREGRILQGAKIQDLAYGALIPTANEKLGAVDGALRGAGFDARLSEKIQQEMWEKWVQLASLGAVTCLLRGNIGDIEAAPGGANLSLAILNECVSILRACGHSPGEEVVARTRSAMTAVGSQSTSSMYRDLAKGAKVEVDSILGDLLERGRAAGVAAPLTEAAFISLRIYQDRINRG